MSSSKPHEDKLVEALAEYAHQSWSGWMRYLFSKCSVPFVTTRASEEGTRTIPRWAVDRWHRQMTTLYRNLPGEERESDRVEARRILDIIRQAGYNVVDAGGQEQ